MTRRVIKNPAAYEPASRAPVDAAFLRALAALIEETKISLDEAAAATGTLFYSNQLEALVKAFPALQVDESE